MGLVDINWTPNRRELRIFSAITLVGCGIIAGVLWSYGYATPAKIVGGIGLAVGVVGLILPPAVKPVYMFLSVVSWPIGAVVSYVVMGIFYYVIITGTGLAFRLVGRDPLQRSPDPNASTYWQPKHLPDEESKERYFRQF